MKAMDWIQKIGGFVRSDGKYRVRPSLAVVAARPGHRLTLYYVEVRQGSAWFVVKDKSGRNTRTWGSEDSAMATIDKEFPMSNASAGNWEYQNNGNWQRKDKEFAVKKVGAGKIDKYIVRWNVGGTDDNWTTLKTKNGRNVRTWGSSPTAMAAIDKEFPMKNKEFPMKNQDASSSAEEKSPEKTRVNMNFIFEGGPAEATRIISMFLSGKNITNLDLKVDGYDPKPVLDLRRGR